MNVKIVNLKGYRRPKEERATESHCSSPGTGHRCPLKSIYRNIRAEHMPVFFFLIVANV